MAVGCCGCLVRLSVDCIVQAGWPAPSKDTHSVSRFCYLSMCKAVSTVGLCRALYLESYMPGAKKHPVLSARKGGGQLPG